MDTTTSILYFNIITLRVQTKNANFLNFFVFSVFAEAMEDQFSALRSRIL